MITPTHNCALNGDPSRGWTRAQLRQSVWGMVAESSGNGYLHPRQRETVISSKSPEHAPSTWDLVRQERRYGKGGHTELRSNHTRTQCNPDHENETKCSAFRRSSLVEDLSQWKSGLRVSQRVVILHREHQA